MTHFIRLVSTTSDFFTTVKFSIICSIICQEAWEEELYIKWKLQSQSDLIELKQREFDFWYSVVNLSNEEDMTGHWNNLQNIWVFESVVVQGKYWLI